MSTRRRSALLVLAAVVALATLAACSSARSRPGATPPAVTAPAGSITVDRWSPPPTGGPPGPASFCTGLTALYGHMSELRHVSSSRVAEAMLSDYVAYAPKVVALAPPAVHDSAATYITAVAGYLGQLVRARLDLARLPPGSLAPLASAPVNRAFSLLSAYSRAECHYTIGGSPTTS